jgi:hypothetical protein
VVVERRVGRAPDHFARTYELRRGEDRTTIAVKSLTTTARHKLLHDAEQFRYLASRSRDGRRFQMLAQDYEAMAADVPDGVVTLSAAQAEVLGEDYNTAIHVRGAPQLAGRALGERPDRDTIVQTFKGDPAGALFFDDLLSPAALLGLKRYLLKARSGTISITSAVSLRPTWKMDWPARCLQITHELPDVSRIARRHPLSQAWAFRPRPGRRRRCSCRRWGYQRQFLIARPKPT